jgi:hypothetical protein
MAPSAPSAVAEISPSGNGLGADPRRTQNGPADATAVRADNAIPASVRSILLKNDAADDADGADAKIATLLGGGAP